MSRREKLSDAAPNTATSHTPQARARLSPCRSGASTGEPTSGPGRGLAGSPAVSPIRGTPFGDTKPPASMPVGPASASASIGATPVSAGTVEGSSRDPSRGPASTTRTRAGEVRLVPAPRK